VRGLLRRLAGRTDGAAQPVPELVELTEEDRRYLTSLYDDSVPLPAGAEERLRPDHPRLVELRAAYDAVDLPVRVPSRWSAERVEGFLDLRWFRGETLITWHYRELPRISRLKYYVMLRYVAERDQTGLLGRLSEDGAFGCWTFEYPGQARVSRDLLESVNELEFLERELGLAARESFSVLDIGAGYGRLAHRMATAYPKLRDYCCVDAIAESTFLSEYYLEFRGVAPPARVVPLHEVEASLQPGSFDLAVNIHSFSECTLQAIEWWVELLARLRVPELVIVPNEPTELLSFEPDGSRQDFAPALAAAGYELTTREPVYADPAVSDLVALGDHFHRFTLRG
jgi:putative sugar O-methyltransferase